MGERGGGGESLTRVWSRRQRQDEAEDEGRRGDHVGTSGDERSRVCPRLPATRIYGGAAMDVMSSVAPKLRTGSPLLRRGGQSCRDCTLMPFLYVGVREARRGSWCVDLVHRCVLFLLPPWALIYIYAIWGNNQAAKFSI